MNRVEAAIQQGRCVLALGAKSLKETEIVAEIRRRSSIPAVVLGGPAVEPAQALSAGALAAATSGPGGLVVLVEPDAVEDGKGLEQLAGLLKSGGNTPRLVVVARAFNPFMLPMGMRLMKLEQEKQRARDFLGALPVPASAAAPTAEDAAPAAAAADPKKKGGAGGGQVFTFVGREKELPELIEALPGGGPLLLLGAPGVGRRWLLEKALDDLRAAGQAPTRLPDLHLQRGLGFDALAARIAEASGDEALRSLLRSREPVAPARILEALEAALSAPALSGQLMVVTGLDGLLGPDNGIYNQDRLGLALHLLLTGSYALRVVFIGSRAPAFYREGQARNLRTFKVEGLRGRELHGIFEAYGAGEAPRDKMGEVHNQTAGHALATRAYAIAWRDSEKRDRLFDEKKFLRLVTADNTEPLIRHLEGQLQKLDEPLARALLLVGHSPVPMTGKELVDLGVSREQRLRLCALGLLDALPVGEERRFFVHELVRDILGRRRLSEFEVMEHFAARLLEQARPLGGVERIALAQEANRLLVGARRPRDRVNLGYPDHDSIVDSVLGLLRGRQARPEMAAQRINEALKQVPGNPELRLLKAEAMLAQSPNADLSAWMEESAALVPTPELYHGWATLLLGQRNGRAQAIEALRKGAAAFPQEARLRRRLGGLLAEAGRYEEADAVLREALDLEPMAPEAYSRRGEVLMALSRERWADAEEAMRYALQLEPERGVHKARLARLLRRRAMVEEDKTEALRAEAKTLLEESLKENTRYAGPFLELALLLLDMNVDIQRADYCLRKANKLSGGKLGGLSLAIARVLARTGHEAEAEKRIQRALKGKGKLHEAHAALGELYFNQGRIFAADKEFEQAVNLSPEDAIERPLYRRSKAQTEALITSGQAIEIEREAEQRRAEAPAPPAGEVKTQSDRGNTTVRRKGERGRGGRGRGGPRPDSAAQGSPEPSAEGAEDGAEGVEPSAEAVEQTSAGEDEELPSLAELPDMAGEEEA